MPTGTGPVADGDFDAWLERVRSTHRAVAYTCSYRLHDPELGARVAVQVTAALVARPSVFRYSGLPFSGRIARLAEGLLADAAAGALGTGCDWPELEARLCALPAAHRDVLVLTCVHGADDAALAAELGCDDTAAAARRRSTLDHMRRVAAPGLPGRADPDGEDDRCH